MTMEYEGVIRLSPRDERAGYCGHQAGLDVLVNLVKVVPDEELVS